MAGPKPDNQHLLTSTPPSTQREPPAWIVESERAREKSWQDRMRALEQVARRCLPICQVNPSIHVHVEHLKQTYPSGTITTKLSFRVTVLDKQYHFSVKTNPGDGHDILAQITAMDCVRRSTDVFPVPNVIAYDESDDNELGRSWIAREYIPGAKLYDRWGALSMEQKQSITRDLARYLAQLYRIRFDKIGSLVYDVRDDTPSPAFTLTDWRPLLVLWCWFWSWLSWSWSAGVNSVTLTPPTRRRSTSFPSRNNKIAVGKDPSITYPDLQKGPFTNARDWFSSRLQQNIRNNLTLAEDDVNWADECSTIISESIRWTEYLRQRPSVAHRERSTTICHFIRDSSIVISDDGELAGLVNWDNLSVCPLWVATAIPDALLTNDNETSMTFEEFTESQSTQFSPAEHVMILEAYAKSIAHLVSTGSDLDNPARYPHYPYRIANHIQLHFRKLEMYEKTRLRDLFLTTMSTLAPDWVTVHSRRKMDTAIGLRVRDLVSGSPRYLRHFKIEFDDCPRWTDSPSQQSWPSDDETIYEGSDVEDER